jgi:DNA-binding NarL/FixJ family response regulator
MLVTPIRLLLVDDHLVVRLGLAALLDGEPGMTVVGEAGNAAEAVALAGQLSPDIVLMDIRLPDRSGIAACQEIRQRWPHIRVIMLTSYTDEDLVLEAIDAGAAGYLLKQLNADELIRALQAVAKGDVLLDASITQKVLQRVRKAEQDSKLLPFRELSDREYQILKLMAIGKTNAEIAADLFLSEKTVGNHVSTILSKLGVTNRIEAATYAVRHNI